MKKLNLLIRNFASSNRVGMEMATFRILSKELLFNKMKDGGLGFHDPEHSSNAMLVQRVVHMQAPWVQNLTSTTLMEEDLPLGAATILCHRKIWKEIKDRMTVRWSRMVQAVIETKTTCKPPLMTHSAILAEAIAHEHGAKYLRPFGTRKVEKVLLEAKLRVKDLVHEVSSWRWELLPVKEAVDGLKRRGIQVRAKVVRAAMRGISEEWIKVLGTEEKGWKHLSEWP